MDNWKYSYEVDKTVDDFSYVYYYTFEIVIACHEACCGRKFQAAQLYSRRFLKYII